MNIEFRKADVSDVKALIYLRKQQLLDEGIPSVNNIDSELESYFKAGLSDDTFYFLACSGGRKNHCDKRIMLLPITAFLYEPLRQGSLCHKYVYGQRL